MKKIILLLLVLAFLGCEEAEVPVDPVEVPEDQSAVGVPVGENEDIVVSDPATGTGDQEDVVTQPATGTPFSAGAECTTADDCVWDACCHATGCVAKANAPNCEMVMCTMECAPDTLDCGQGSCTCVDGKCGAEITGNI